MHQQRQHNLWQALVLCALLVLVVGSSGTARADQLQEPNNSINNSGELDTKQQDNFRTADANHRDLGFFVNRGRRRRSRGRRGRRRTGRSARGPAPTPPTGQSLPNINRDRDPLEEGGWTQKRVDMIRPSSLVRSPNISPVQTPAPVANTTRSPVSLAPTTTNITASNVTLDPGGNTTASPSTLGATSAPTIAAAVTTTAPSIAEATAEPTAAPTTDGDGDTIEGDTAAPSFAVDTAVPSEEEVDADETPAPSIAGATASPTIAGEAAAPSIAGDTAAPTIAGATAAPSAAVAAADENIIEVRSSVASDVICKYDGPQDFAFGIDIKVIFADDHFQACTGNQFNALSSILETTLNVAFPNKVPSWTGEVHFHSFFFDVDQFLLHINPYSSAAAAAADNNGRHLLRTTDNGHATALEDDPITRRQLQEGTCPTRPNICEDTTDVCLYGCGIASVADCGDLSVWKDSLGSALSIALAEQSLSCLGGQPVVELTVLQVQ